MIDLYGMNSPNVVKIAIMLEEIGRPYRTRHVGAVHDDARTSELLALNPLGKVPVIVDDEGTSAGQPIFESGAIHAWGIDWQNFVGLGPLSTVRLDEP